MESVALLLGIGTGVLSVFTFLGGVYAYVKSSERKKFASEREIGYLQKAIEKLSANTIFLTQEMDRRGNSVDIKLSEIKTSIEYLANSNRGKKRDFD